MMPAAKRYGELVAHLETNRSRLSKPQVMGIGRLPATDETRLRGNKFQVCLVAQSFGFGNRELTFVDPARGQFVRGRGQRGGLILPEQVGHRAGVAPAVVVRRPWDWSCIVRV